MSGIIKKIGIGALSLLVLAIVYKVASEPTSQPKTNTPKQSETEDQEDDDFYLKLAGLVDKIDQPNLTWEEIAEYYSEMVAQTSKKIFGESKEYDAINAFQEIFLTKLVQLEIKFEQLADAELIALYKLSKSGEKENKILQELGYCCEKKYQQRAVILAELLQKSEQEAGKRNKNGKF